MIEQPKRVDRLSQVTSMELSEGSLVGTYFHSFNPDGTVEWQGCIVAEPHTGYFLVETFDWSSGSSFCQHLVRIENMLTWRFYDDADWMRNAYHNDLSLTEEAPE